METTTKPVTASSMSLGGTLSRPRFIAVMGGIMLTMLLAALDQTIVGTAMPRIIADLSGLDRYAWVFTAYMLTSTVSIPVYGKLSDIYGRKPFFIVGVVIFLAGSALSGQSHTMNQLIIFRGVQGLGAGAMMPLTMALIGDIIPPSERGKWQGLLMSVFGLSSIVGPTVGGYITQNIGWQWVFYVNLPIGILALIVTMLALPHLRSSERKHTVDYLGVALITAAVVPLLLGFTFAGSQYAWGSPQVVGLLALSVIMTVVLIWWERRQPEPIISPALFKNDIFTVSTIITFLFGMGFFGAVLFLPLFMQGIVGLSPTDAGNSLAPMMFGFILSSIVGGQIISRWPHYRIVALVGLGIGIAGMVLLTGMGANTTQGIVIRNMVILGLGLGVQMSLYTIVVQNAFPMQRIGEVTANLTFFRSIGGAIGVAIMGTILNNSFKTAFLSNLPSTLKTSIPPAFLTGIENPQVLLSSPAQEHIRAFALQLGPAGAGLLSVITQATKVSLALAIDHTFVLGVVIMSIAFVAAFFLREIPLRGRMQVVAAEPVLAASDGAAAPALVGQSSTLDVAR